MYSYIQSATNTRERRKKQYGLRIFGALATIVLLALVAGTMLLLMYNDTKSVINEINSHNETQISRINAEHDAEMFNLKASQEAQIIQLDAQYQQEIELLNTQNAELTDENAQLTAELQEVEYAYAEKKEREFSLYKKYWYVLQKAPDNGTWSMDLIEHIDNICKENDINPHLVFGIINVESNYRVDVVSSAGARGMCQFMPRTGRWIYEEKLGHGAGTYDHSMCSDPYINSEMCVAYLVYLINGHDGNMQKVLANYNGSTGTAYYNLVKNAMSAVGQNVESKGYR